MSKLLIVALAVVVGACTANPAPSPTPQPVPTPTPTTAPAPTDPMGLAGRSFLSTKFTDAGVDRPLVANTRARLDFRDGDRLGANAGCNSMGASYSVENGTLRTTDAASTAMGCEGGLGKQEEWVFALITSGPTLALDGNELTLTKGDLVGTFLDIEAAQPDLTLGNRVWTLTTIVDSDIASSVPDGVVASLEWKEDGGVIVSTGCNTGLARPTVTGNEIEFGPIGLTKKACPGAADQVERAVMTVLSAGSVTYEIQSNTLILRAGDRGLDLTAPA